MDFVWHLTGAIKIGRTPLTIIHSFASWVVVWTSNYRNIQYTVWTMYLYVAFILAENSDTTNSWLTNRYRPGLSTSSVAAAAGRLTNAMSGEPKKRDQDGWGGWFLLAPFWDRTLMLLKFTNCLPCFKCKQLPSGFQAIILEHLIGNHTCHEHDVSNFWPTQAQRYFAFANLKRNRTKAQETCKLKDYMSFMSGRNQLPRRVIWIGLK